MSQIDKREVWLQMYEGIVSIFRKIEDPRRGNAIDYDLIEVLIIAVLSIICGAQYFTQMEAFGHDNIEWLKTFLVLKNGIPSHDTFGDVFAALDPESITKAFAEWVETIRQKISGEVVAIDGKTICASKDIPKNKKATHIVSAWATQNRLVLGQLATEVKSNEITAIPKLLKLLDLKGCIVTIDAMGTQTKIAEAIIDKGANYILTVKENQPALRNDILFYFDSEDTSGFDTAETSDNSHGRVEYRKIVISKDIGWLDPEGRWKNLSGIALYITRTENLSTGKIEQAVTPLIFSDANATAEQILYQKRAHWGVENSLHWRLDVAYDEDNCRVRAGNAAIVFNMLRHLSLNILMQETTSKGGVKVKMFRCANNKKYLEKVIGVPESKSSAN